MRVNKLIIFLAKRAAMAENTVQCAVSGQQLANGWTVYTRANPESDNSMSNQPKPSVDLNVWEVQNLQLIAFPRTSAIGIQQNWWRDLVGDEPSDFVRTDKKLLREEKGTCSGVTLSLVIDPFRIVWVATMPAELSEPPPLLMTIGTLPERRDWFQEIMTRWLTNACPLIKRLGFGGKLLRRVESHEAGYKMLSAYLPSVNVDPESTDFLYRINRRRIWQSELSTLQINRLSTWSCLKIAGIAGVHIGDALQASQVEEAYACSVDLDINTAPEGVEELAPSILPNLFGGLIGMGSELLTKGDLP